MPLIHRSMRLLAAGTVAMLGLLIVRCATAACLPTSSSGYVGQIIYLDLGQIAVPSTLPVGGVILTRSFPVTPKSSTTFHCDLFTAGYSRLTPYQSAFGILAVGVGAGVFNTAVDGIGIRLQQTVVVAGGGTSTLYYPAQINYAYFQYFGIPSSNLVVELIQTSAVVGSGPIGTPGLAFGQMLDGIGGLPPILAINLRDGGTTIQPPTCTPSAGSLNIAVDFGKVSRSVFSGVGSVSASRDFKIELDCQSSSLPASTVGVRVDAPQDASNLPGVLPLNSSADAASGIAIQLVKGGAQSEQTLRFGESSVLASGAMNAGKLVLPLRARYIQTTQGAVRAGKANGMATFTIQYN